MERACLAVRRRLQAGLQLPRAGGGTSARVTSQKRRREYALNDWQPVQPKDTSLKLPSKPQRAFRPTHGSDAEMTAAAAADDARTLDSDVLLAHQRRLAALGPTGHTGCAGTAADDRAVHAAG